MPTKKWNYYNEIDKKCCAWIKELIANGLVPDGEVDNRSISDVQPDDLKSFRQCHFFAGILGWPYALRLAGWPDDRPIWTASLPCQPWSSAGQQAGHTDERHLWPCFFRLVEAKRPPLIIGEQVASSLVLGSLGKPVDMSWGNPCEKTQPVWLDGIRIDMERLQYAIGAADLPSACVGSPNIRQRLYWMAYAEHAHRRPKLEINPDTYWRDGSGGCGDTGGVVNTGLPKPSKWGNSSQEGNSEPCDELASSGRDGRLEHPESDGREQWRPESGGRFSASGCESGRLGESNSTGRVAGKSSGETAGHGCAVEPTGDLSRLAHPDGMRGSEQEQQLQECGSRIKQSSGSGGLDNPTSPRHDGTEQGTKENSRNETWLRMLGERSPWDDYAIIPTRDGKNRRVPSVECGIQPLASGLPKGMVYSSDPSAPTNENETAEARVMRLRGYGNSINAWLAAVFIKACKESLESLTKEPCVHTNGLDSTVDQAHKHP